MASHSLSAIRDATGPEEKKSSMGAIRPATPLGPGTEFPDPFSWAHRIPDMAQPGQLRNLLR